MTELREKVAAKLRPYMDSHELERDDHIGLADAILDLPEIKEALEALERETDRKLGHKI